VFASDRGGKSALYERFANGGGEEELLLKPDEEIYPLSWSRNGRFLAVGTRQAGLQTQFVITLDSKGQPAGKPVVFARKGLGIDLQFSPDVSGPPHWIAYQSTRDGKTEGYLREFDPNSLTLTPANGTEWQVSKGGGTSPRWNPNGKELFYLAPDRTVMAVNLTGDPKHLTSLPESVFKPDGIERVSQAGIADLSWDVSRGGERFLFPIPVPADRATPPHTVVLNWTSLLTH
jgi:Tol biopolymer transport system component